MVEREGKGGRGGKGREGEEGEVVGGRCTESCTGTDVLIHGDDLLRCGG